MNSVSVEDVFLVNIASSVTPPCTVIISMPSLESLPYASPGSKEGHVNCKMAPDLKAAMQRHFHEVFIFSMSDEVVHIGFPKLAHYLFGLCAGKRNRALPATTK